MDPNPYSSPQATATHSLEGAVPPAAVDALARTRGWVTFLAVLLFIGIGIFGLVAIGFVIAAALGQGAGIGGPEALIILPLFLVMGVFYLFPALAFNRYSRAIRNLVASPEPANLEAAVDAHRRIWKLFGVLTITFIALYIVIIIVAVVAAFSLAPTVLPPM